jgi:hypothetical protein
MYLRVPYRNAAIAKAGPSSTFYNLLGDAYVHIDPIRDYDLDDTTVKEMATCHG